MTWLQLHSDWWHGSEGAWVRLSIQFDCDGSCKRTENTTDCRSNPRQRYIGWRDGMPVLYWFSTLAQAKQAVERQPEAAVVA